MVARFLETQAEAAGTQLVMPPYVLAYIFLATSDGFRLWSDFDPDATEMYKHFLELMMPAVIRDESD
jgi:hypothetical protein